MIQSTTWMNLENIMLSEISLTQQDKHSVIPLILRYLKQVKSLRQKIKQRLPGAEERGVGELLFNGHRVSVWDDEKVLETDRANDCPIL